MLRFSLKCENILVEDTSPIDLYVYMLVSVAQSDVPTGDRVVRVGSLPGPATVFCGN